MTKVTTEKKTRVPVVDTLESVAWKKHRELLLQISVNDAQFRGCFGLALVVEAARSSSWLERLNHLFIPDATVKWASITDLPEGHFRLERSRREVHWATLRPTTVRYGMPMLAQGSEGPLAWDFRAIPYGVERRAPNTFPDTATQLFRVFNAIEMAMTSTAYAFRANWRSKQRSFCKMMDLPFSAASKTLCFGDAVFDHVESPYGWMPQAYLGFPVKLLPKLFSRATSKNMADDSPLYPEELRDAFVRSLPYGSAYQARSAGCMTGLYREIYCGLPVFRIELRAADGTLDTIRFSQSARIHCKLGEPYQEGTVLAEEPWKLYERLWSTQTMDERWNDWVPRLCGKRIDSHLRIWFERQYVRLDAKLLHFPAGLCSVAAMGNAQDASLYWDVRPALAYYRESCDAFVFPTLPMECWDGFVGSLPGAFGYDLTPNHPNYVPRLKSTF